MKIIKTARRFGVIATTLALTLAAGTAIAGPAIQVLPNSPLALDSKGSTLDAPAIVRAEPRGSAPVVPLFNHDARLASEVEPNGDAATATPLGGSSARIQGHIVPNGDLDFYSFTAAAGDRVYAATMTSSSSNASVDSALTLFASDGTTALEVDADDGSFGATSSSIAGTVIPAAGTYYLRVQHAVATNQLRPYWLYFQLRSGAPVAEVEPNDTFPGTALPAGNWVAGATSAVADVDFYSVTLAAGETVFLSVDLDPERDTVEWNAQIGLGTFGTPPLVLVVNDAGSATPDSEAFFMTAKTAGTYGILVGTPAGGTTFGSYHLSATVYPALAPPAGGSCTTYTSTNVPVAIADGPSIQTSTLTIPGNPRIADLDVTLNITHNFMADMDIQLTAPGGNTVGLLSDIGSVTAGAQTTMDLTLDDEAAVPSLFTVTQNLRLRPELNYRLAWFDGQDAGGSWTLTIRDDATGDGGTLTGWSMDVCEPPPPAPVCPPGLVDTIVYSTDFEAGDGGFTHAGTADEWERGNPTLAPVTGCNSGTNCWKTDLDNTYEVNSNQDLLSPGIDLTGLQAPIVVRWAQRFQLEAAQFDRHFIELRQVGTPANAVRLFEHFGADMVENVGNPVVGLQYAAGWGQYEARADSLAGLNTEFRANLSSDNTVQRGGLAIDDVSVIACRTPSADLAITKTDGVVNATPGGSVTYTITASHVGGDPVTGATVADTFPAPLTCTWTCVGAGGGTCTAAGSGNINDVIDLPVGGSATYTATCAIAAGALGTLANTASVSSAITDPVMGNNSETDTDTLVPQADIAITKTDGVTTAVPGGSTTYSITASNAGPSDAPGVTIADTFPASLTCTWTCLGTGGGTCTAAGAGNISDSVNLPSGGSVSYTATCAISAAAVGMLTNTATSTSAIDPNAGNNSASDTDTLTPQAGLSITKTDGVLSATPGGSVTYTINASNAGPSNAPGAAVTDTFPAALTCTWTCVGAGGGTCTAAGAGNINDTVNLPSGGSTTYTASCTISASASGTLVNTADVSAPAGVTDPNMGDNSATDTDTLDASADLSITKTDGVANVTAGGNTIYTIVASNAGPSAATGATVTDTFAPELTCSWTCLGASGGTCTAAGSGNIGDSVNLPAGASVTYSANCAVSGAAAVTLVNTATVAVPAGTSDPNTGNDSATDTDIVDPQGAIVTGSKSVSGTLSPGGGITYTVTLTASAGAQADNPGNEFTDVLPASLTLVSASASSGTAVANVGTNTVTWNGPIAGGGSVTITISATVGSGASGVVSNQGNISYDSDANGSNDATAVTDDPGTGAANDPTSFTVGAGQADLSITKTDGVTTTTPGGTLIYTIVASNAGPADATAATVTDTFPASLTCTWTCAGTGGGTCTAAGAGNIGDSVNLPSGASVSYSASCAVAASATGTVANTATVSAPAGVTDPNGGNNSAIDSDTVDAQADLAVSLSDTPDPVTAGNSVTYVAQLTNSGPSAADAVSLSLPLDADTTFVSAVASAGGVCATPAVGATGTISCSWAGATAPAGVRNLTVIAQVALAATGPLSATVTAASTTTDPTPANNTATAATAVGAASADLSLALSATPSPVSIGGTVTLTATGSNAGPSDAQNAVITIVLPANLLFATVDPGIGGVCTTPAVGSSGSVVCTYAGATPAGSSRVVIVTATAPAAGSANVTATLTSTTTDPTPADAQAVAAVQIGGAVAPSRPVIVPALEPGVLLLLGLLLGLIGMAVVRRQH
jgi:uncharacterized repeat protein (TIGR01451 family)